MSEHLPPQTYTAAEAARQRALEKRHWPPKVEFTERQVQALLWAVDAHFHATPVDAASGETWEALKRAAAKLEEVAPWLEGTS